MLDPRMVATSTHTPTFRAQGFLSGAASITPSSHGDFTKLAIFYSHFPRDNTVLLPPQPLHVTLSRSEGSLAMGSEMLRSTQHDNAVVLQFPRGCRFFVSHALL